MDIRKNWLAVKIAMFRFHQPQINISIVNTDRLNLVILYCFRYDTHYLPGFADNFTQFPDAFLSFDDRANGKEWYHEGDTRNKLINAARYVGFNWVLCLDPDERICKDDLPKIRRLMEIYSGRKVIFEFPFREMWTQEAYRVDGIWGNKAKRVMSPLFAGQRFQNQRLHSAWCPMNEDYDTVKIDIPIYHLKMIKLENRVKRVEIYKKIDSNKKYQPIGYDYLIDETGIQLASIHTDCVFPL